jgi:hypothetical protein
MGKLEMHITTVLIGKPQPLGKSSMILQEVLGTTYEGYFP